jgi:hypothetical protein
MAVDDHGLFLIPPFDQSPHGCQGLIGILVIAGRQPADQVFFQWHAVPRKDDRSMLIEADQEALVPWCVPAGEEQSGGRPGRYPTRRQ